MLPKKLSNKNIKKIQIIINHRSLFSQLLFIQGSKFDFGNKLAELYGFNKSYIKKGTINNYFGYAKRNSKLDLDCTKLTSIEPNILSWEESLELFVDHKYSLYK